ncbi:phosphotransferase [Litchfieldia salsa]|uniref:Aminoglycoside 3'-phosphotransferase-2 n=1 Tax=Litchfieldia salsa TaxID=930152 RepID=A0A1H0SW43_9BACI|nr:phosphotransferase [Litchfieldia salsa]SDP45884.1 aminoglycoside 3'-phosphotransferase-2 [Litchfieldia salsa]
MNEGLFIKLEELIGSIYEIEKLNEQGCTSEVRRIITDHRSYLLKSAFKERYRKWLNTEAQVLKKLNTEKLISVPEYFGFILEKNSSHLIMSFEGGLTLTTALNRAPSSTERKALIKSFGEFLHQFHEKKPLEILRNSSDWLEEQLIKAQFYVENGQTEGSLKLLNHLKTNKPLSVIPTMIHGDCTTDNVFVIDGAVKLFIDVAGMTVGDPRYDESLAIREFINNPEDLAAFYDGYKRYRVTEEEFKYFDQGLYEFF